MSIIFVSDAENIENDNKAHHVTNERPLEVSPERGIWTFAWFQRNNIGTSFS